MWHRHGCLSKPSASKRYLVTTSVSLTVTQVLRKCSPKHILKLLETEDEISIQRHAVNPSSPTFFQLITPSPTRIFPSMPPFFSFFQTFFLQFSHQRNPASRSRGFNVIVATWEVFLGSEPAAPLLAPLRPNTQIIPPKGLLI